MIPYNKSLLTITCLAAANTMPMYLATFALPTIMRSQGVSLTIIGLFGGLMLPWALKFLWAPLLDKHYSKYYGKRKSWFVLAQLLILLLLFLIYYIRSEKYPGLLFSSILILLISSATHYMATSAYILEQMPSKLLQFGNYAQVVGTACGSFIGGGLFLIIYARFGWHNAILSILILSAILFFVQLNAREDNILDTNLHLTNAKPSVLNFIKRGNMRHLLYFCLIYRGCEGLVMGMQQPFLVDQHISVDIIGKVMGISGLTLSLLASGFASLMLKKQTETVWLLILGVLRSFCYLLLGAISYFKITFLVLIFGCVTVNMALRSMEMVVLYTFFMKNCDSKQVATDISILLCSEIIIYSLGIMLSGYLVKVLGYTGLFVLGGNLSFITTAICAYIIYKIIFMDKQLTQKFNLKGTTL